MNNTPVIFFANSLKNSTSVQIQNSDGITQSLYLILDKILEVLTTAGNLGFWKFLIVFFAIIGFFALIAAVLSRILDGTKIIFKVFILLPAIFIVGIINRKKRKKRLEEWGEIKKDFKENSKKIKLRYWILWIGLRIVLPAILVIFLVWVKW